MLPNRKNPNLTVTRVFSPGSELGLTGELLLRAPRSRVFDDDETLVFSGKRGPDGALRAR